MADNALVTPIVFKQPAAINSRTQDKFQTGSQSMPATVTKIVGEMVTVKIENQGNFTIPEITVPQAFSAYIREPTQVGDKGFVHVPDYYMGGQSQLGGGNADYFDRSNLTNAVFIHNSQKAFPTNPNRDLNAVFLAGPNGVVMQDTQGACTFTLTPSGIVIKIGGMTLTINGSGIDVEGGDIVNNSLTVGSTHVHSGIVVGGANTGPPNP